MHRTIAAYFKFSYERNRLNFTWIGPFDVVYIEMGTYLSAVWFSWTSINLSSSKEILCCYIFPVQSSRDGSNCFSKGSGNFVLLCGNFRAEETVGSGIGSPFIDEIQEGLGNSGAQSADEAGVFCAVPPTACNRGKLHPPNRSVKFCCSRRCDKKEEKQNFFSIWCTCPSAAPWSLSVWNYKETPHPSKLKRQEQEDTTRSSFVLYESSSSRTLRNSHRKKWNLKKFLQIFS